MPLLSDPIRHYARLGAVIRLAQLDAERRVINRTFPGLHWQRTRTTQEATDTPSRRGRRTLTAAQRTAISERMTKTWAERRRKASKDGT